MDSTNCSLSLSQTTESFTGGGGGGGSSTQRVAQMYANGTEQQTVDFTACNNAMCYPEDRRNEQKTIFSGIQ